MLSPSPAFVRSFLLIALGTAIYAFGLHYFVIPNRLMEGGVTGIALLFNYMLHIPPSVTSLCLNIPLFFVGWRAFGKSDMLFTIIGTVLMSFFLFVMELSIHNGWIVPFQSEHDMILAVLYAGVTLGIGLGLVFRNGGTTGGIDIVARIANKRKNWSMGQIILTFDAIVIGLSLFYIPKEKVLYTLVTVFIASKIIDFFQEGIYAAKAFTIVSDFGAAISEQISKELEHGVTIFPARGVYSKLNKEVVYCIVYRHEVVKLKALVRNIDSRAFMIIHDVHDVLGEGFREE